jgi:capsular exopolysaccharide synthesis family protein
MTDPCCTSPSPPPLPLHLRNLQPDPQLSSAASASDGAFGSYLRAIRAHPLLVAAVTLATLVSAVAWLALRSETYESSAQMLVTPLPQSDETFLGLQLLRDSGDPTRTVQTAATLVESQQAADRAAEKLGGGLTGEALLTSIEVEPQGESNVLAVTARASSADEAARRANEFAQAALDTRDEALSEQIDAAIERLQTRIEQQPGDQTDEQSASLEQLESVRSEGDPTLQLSQPAVGGTAVGTSKPVVIFLALLAGLALGSVAAVLAEMADRRVRTEDELLTLFPLPVLARIPLYSKSQWSPPGASSNGLPWQMPPGVREGFRTLVAQLESSTNGSGGKTVLVTSASTGDGKTTSAINLAVSLAAGGESVILIDSDIRKPDVGATLGIGRAARLRQVLDESSKLSSFLKPAPHLPKLSVLALRSDEGNTTLVESMNRRLPQLIAEAKTKARYVVVDTAPLGEVSDALHIAGEADDIVIVTRPGHSNRTYLVTMRDLLSRSGNVPTGFVVIGNLPGMSSSSYYGYGYGAAARQLAGHPGDSA